MTAAFNLVRLNNATTLLGGIRNPEYQRREKFSPRGDDGTVHETSNAVLRTAPMARFSTVAVRALNALLTGSSELPMAVMSGSAVNGLELIAGKINTAGPGYLGGSVHKRRYGVNGQVYLSGLSWRPGDVLEAMIEAFWFSAAGGTDPITPDSIALPTIPVNTEQLVLTSLTVGGTTLTNVESYEAQIAHQCENNDEAICYNTGLPHPVALREAGVGGPSQITVTVETLDLETAIASSGTIVAVFTALNPLGVGIASNILTATLNSALIREESIPGRMGQPGTRRMVAHGTFDGTNRPFTLVNG